jgi:hypothetical protein
MKFNALLLIALLAILASCAYVPYARDVKRSSSGGVIAMHVNYRQEDRSKAEQMMATVCNGKEVKVLEEGEVVTGTKTNTAASTSEGSNSVWNLGKGFSNKPSVDTSAESTTTQLKEWQISYTCVEAKKGKK